MRVSYTITGAADLAKRLRELPKAVGAKVQTQALIAGAEPMRREASSRAPRGSGTGPHLADDIVIGTVSARRLESQGRGDQTVVEVGPSKRPHDHFYGYFQEFGTVHHRARPFMRPAFDLQARNSLNLALMAMWTAIRKALPQSFGGRSAGAGNL